MNRFWILAVAGLLTPGCTVHSVDEDPKAPIEMPAGFDRAGTDGAELGDGRWWMAFGDERLNRLVQDAISDSFELRMAWARLRQAEAIAVQTGSALYPSVDGQIGVSGARTLRPNPLTGATEASTDPLYSASLPVSYELDVFGRIRSAKSAAEQDVLAFRDDVEAIAITLSANIAEQWFNVVEQRSSRQLLEDQRATNGRYLELVRLRFLQGQSIASDIYQQRSLVDGIDAQLVITEAQETAAWQQLAVLTGGASMRYDEQGGTSVLPELPALPAAGLPSELLQRRPDIRAARRRVIAADHRVGEAIAARYPSFRMTGAVGLQSTDIEKIFDDFVWNLGGNVAMSLFDGGRRAAEVDRTEWVLEERIAAYGLALQRAVVEVDTSLVAERQQAKSIGHLKRQVETAQASLDAAQTRYREGQVDYLVVLTSLRGVQQAETALLSAQRRLLSQRIQLYRALGGTWTSELEAPKPLRRDADDDDADDEETDR